MDYPTLVAPKSTSGSLANWTNWAPSATSAAEIIKNAQDELFSRLRVREMRKSLTIALNQGDSTAPLPADYLDTATLVDPYGTKVKRVSDDRLITARAYDSTGALIQSMPRRHGVFDNLFQFDCAALQAMTLNGMYYGATYISPAVPANGAIAAVPGIATNFLTDRYSHLFRAMLLKHAYAYRKDWTAVPLYAAQVEQLINDVEMGDDLSYRDLDDADAGDRP